MNRREFNALAAAAFGGVVAGTVAGCGKKDDKGKTEKTGEGSGKKTEGGDETKTDPTLLTQEPNVCRGLNTCKDKGKGEHECAGQGMCATAKAHSCHGENDCRGQGGCGDTAGQNLCKKKGECNVPLKADTWKKARANFEEQMKKAGKKFGDAPPKMG